jgi:hypothetical protein
MMGDPGQIRGLENCAQSSRSLRTSPIRLVVLALCTSLIVSCGALEGADVCEPVVEDLTPVVQSVVRAIDQSDMEAFEEAAADMGELRQLAIDSGCPAETLRLLLADRAESFDATTEAGRAAIEDLMTNGPFQYTLAEDSSEPTSTLPSTTPTT